MQSQLRSAEGAIARCGSPDFATASSELRITIRREGEDMNTRIATLLGLAACAASMIGAALAQSYPVKTVRIVIPQAPGAQSDLFTRMLGQKMSESMGQPVINDPRPGAGGAIGAEVAARAAPDGYTLLMGTNSTHSANPALYSKLPYDPVKDF